jgi:hypothetical protein
LKLSVAVVAHQSRADLVADLVDRLGVDADRVMWDRIGNQWDTAVRAWRHHDPDADWHLVIEDDALPCRDLLAGVARGLARLPVQSTASLYMGESGRRWTRHATRGAGRRGPTWVKVSRLIWGVAMLAPVSSIANMLEWCEAHPVPTYDHRVSRYYFHRLAWPTFYAWPCLVEHRDVESLRGGPRGRHAARFVGEDFSALDIDWTARPVPI